MLLLIDNFDSFTYNLVHLIGPLLESRDCEIKVVRNTGLDRTALETLQPRYIVISPGPGRPEDAGVTMEAIRFARDSLTPLLGVCLGMQALGAVFGTRVVHAPHLMHGKISLISHDGRGLYRGVNGSFEATRYHSLVLERESLHPDLMITSHSDDGVIQGVSHVSLPLHGVQYHPESIASHQSQPLIHNFLNLA